MNYFIMHSALQFRDRRRG